MVVMHKSFRNEGRPFLVDAVKSPLTPLHGVLAAASLADEGKGRSAAIHRQAQATEVVGHTDFTLEGHTQGGALLVLPQVTEPEGVGRILCARRENGDK